MTRVGLSTRSSVRDSMDKKQVRRRNNGYINANKLTRRVWNIYLSFSFSLITFNNKLITSRKSFINYPFQIALLDQRIYSQPVFFRVTKASYGAIQCLHYRGEPLPWLKKLAVRIADARLEFARRVPAWPSRDWEFNNFISLSGLINTVATTSRAN